MSLIFGALLVQGHPIGEQLIIVGILFGILVIIVAIEYLKDKDGD